MKKRKVLSIVLGLSIAISPLSSLAHSGRTDGSGGHRDNKNKSGLGSYHYHCGGYEAHLHNNGVCPYNSSAKKTTTKTVNKSNETTKKVQKKLNELGYDAGTADGIAGTKTKNAIKAFQKKNNLTADGIAGKNTLKALGL